ncbi:alpha/beta hydrolase [Kitasatospora purpeofusca]|uniref:alpha/beta hydrolase n=1 Tax=Kitasatospora purpeofusca TaxID=67352 RepID=UPI000689E589|nr:hypothetical protein [Kitasatospora purpeofusca]
MVSIWHPARGGAARSTAPWMPPAAADRYLGLLGLPPGRVRLGGTHGHEGAPVGGPPGPLPVVLYSPGADASRSFGTGIVEDLSSHGFAVVTVDHTYDAAAVAFHGGRVETNPPGGISDYTKALPVRTADIRFALDRLAVLRSGGHPGVCRTPLPAGLRGALDLRRVCRHPSGRANIRPEQGRWDSPQDHLRPYGMFLPTAHAVPQPDRSPTPLDPTQGRPR